MSAPTGIALSLDLASIGRSVREAVDKLLPVGTFCRDIDQRLDPLFARERGRDGPQLLNRDLFHWSKSSLSQQPQEAPGDECADVVCPGIQPLGPPRVHFPPE